jgi:hypothetical protein
MPQLQRYSFETTIFSLKGLICLFSTATMTDTMPDNQHKHMTTFQPTGTNNNQDEDKKRSLDDEIPKKKKFQRLDVNNNLGNEKIGRWVNEMPEGRGEWVRPGVLATITFHYPDDVVCDRTCSLWNDQLCVPEGYYPEDMKICFPTFDNTYGNCNLARTEFENITLCNPDKAR